MRTHCLARRSFARGFTLVEIVVALTISTLVVGMAALAITTPVNAYVDAADRAERTDGADLIVRRLEADLKRAVPNSVRISVSGSRAIIEMLTYDSMTFYRTNNEITSPLGAWTPADRELSNSGVDNVFSAFGRLDPSINGSRRYVVVNNRGDNSTRFDAYRLGGSNVVITTAPVLITVTPDPGGTYEQRVTLGATFPFPDPSRATGKHRLFVVDRPVTYICNATANTQTLRRFDNYAIAATAPTAETNARLLAPGVNNALIANDIATCRFRCDQGTTARPCRGGLIVELTVQRATTSGNEVVRVFRQFPVDNAL